MDERSLLCSLEKNRGNSVRIVTMLRAELFLSPERSDRMWGPHSLLFTGYRLLIFRLLSVCSVNLSPAFSTEVRADCGALALFMV